MRKQLLLLAALLAAVFLAGCTSITDNTSDEGQQQALLQYYCKTIWLLEPEPGQSMERAICSPAPTETNPSGKFNIREETSKAIEGYFTSLDPAKDFFEKARLSNPDYRAKIAEAWSQWIVAAVSNGTEEFNANSAIKITCTQNPGKPLLLGIVTPPVWSASIQLIEDCGATGKTCETPDPATKTTELPDGNLNSAACVAPAVTPPPAGKYFLCEQTACTLHDCPEGKTECPELSATDCQAGEEGLPNSCGVAPPPAAGLNCGNRNALDVHCGQWVPNSPSEGDYTASYKDYKDQDKPECPNGNYGTRCDTENEYCDSAGSEWQCKPISAALCDTTETHSVSESASPTSWVYQDKDHPCNSAMVDGAYGAYCSTGVCDIEGKKNWDTGAMEGAGACINPQLSADNAKYDYTIGGRPADATGIALNFNPVANKDYQYPMLCSPIVFCPSCANQLIDVKNLEQGLAISFERIKAKSGVTHFTLNARSASGQGNYAKIRYKDVQPSGTGKTAAWEQFVVQVDAPQIGECALESGGSATGESSSKAKALLSYNWNFETPPAIDMHFCEIVDNSPASSPHFCDATQFMISLLKRLNQIKTDYEAATPDSLAEAASLQQFNTLLMADSFNANFRTDFAYFFETKPLAETPSWYNCSGNCANYDGFRSFVSGTGASHLVLDPVLIARPGKYKVTISITGGPSFFTADHQPNATFTIGFIPLPTPSGINLDNALYYLPLDGEIKGTDGTRNGYGTGIGGAGGIPVKPVTNGDFRLNPVAGGLRAVQAFQSDSFSETNKPANRGRILQVKLLLEGKEPSALVTYNNINDNILVFAPIVATPVALKTTVEAAQYSLNGTGSLPDASTEIASWTGLASKRLTEADPSCSDFKGNPLPTRKADQPGNEANARTLFFEKPGSAEGKFLVLGTVFYNPRYSSAPTLRAAENGVTLLSADQITSAQQPSLNLNYTDTGRFNYLSQKGLTIAYLQDLLDVVNNNTKTDTGPICMVTKKTMNGNTVASIETVYYWNRGALLNEIVDKSHTQLAPPNSNNDITQLGVADSVRCQ